MADYVVMPESDYKKICNSVRAKTGGTEDLKSGEISSEIDTLSLGSDVSGVTATAADVLKDKIIVGADGNPITGTMPIIAQATPTISVSSSGLITTSSTQDTSGYLEAGTKSATNQLSTQAAKTVTPGTSAKTAVEAGVYTTGAIKVGAIPSSYVKDGYKMISGTVTTSSNSSTLTFPTISLTQLNQFILSGVDASSAPSGSYKVYYVLYGNGPSMNWTLSSGGVWTLQSALSSSSFNTLPSMAIYLRASNVTNGNVTFSLERSSYANGNEIFTSGKYYYTFVGR